MTEPTPGKGRPTPKRREAQRRRRQPVTAPKTRREAARAMRARQREARVSYREALRTGDERHLPPRDQGPVKRYVRDVVDARRNAGNYLLWVALAVVVVGWAVNLVPSLFVRTVVALAYPLVLVWVVVDAVLLARTVKRKVRERFPNEPTRGLASYAVTRSFQMRRLRLPPARVKVGDRV